MNVAWFADVMGSGRSNAPRQDAVATFLSCSIRRQDLPLVQALDQKVLQPMGFRCVTVGRNISEPDQADDVIRSVLRSTDCLIGVATTRFNAVDRDFPERSLVVATPYLLQESAMAFQCDIPFLIVKTPEITLQGVTNRNLYIEISGQLRDGRVRFRCSKEMLLSSLRSLRQRALERRNKQSREDLISGLAKVSALIGAGFTAKTIWDWLARPDCFGDFYYRDPACKTCGFKSDCKAEKARRQ